MYEVNLPREFVHPPLYLMRHESKPKVLAKRLAGKRGALRFRPTLRQDVQIGRRPPQVVARPGRVARKTTAVIPKAASAAVAPAVAKIQRAWERVAGGAGMRPARTQVIAGKPVAKITNGAIPTKRAMPMPKRPVRAGEPVVKMFRYAPEGGFMPAFARSGNKAIRIRPKGVVSFRPHPVVQAKPR